MQGCGGRLNLLKRQPIDAERNLEASGKTARPQRMGLTDRELKYMYVALGTLNVPRISIMYFERLSVDTSIYGERYVSIAYAVYIFDDVCLFS